VSAAPASATDPSASPGATPGGALGNAAPADAAPKDAVAETPRVRTSLRRRLFWIAVVIVALLTAVVTIGLGFSTTAGADRYSIDDAGPGGSRAVAEVLRGQGVDVVSAGSLAEARDAAESAGGDVTVLFSDPFAYLDAEHLSGVKELARQGARLVLVEPDSVQLRALTDGIANAGAPGSSDAIASSCALPAAERAGTITAPLAVYRDLGDVAGTVACFPAGDDTSALIEQPVGTASGSVTAFGAGDALTNGVIAEQGNAALALGVLGERDTLVWYRPGPDDLAGGAPATLGSLTPGWVTPVILLLVLVVVAAGIWRGRRFGPVVVENLPVTVRASETMEGRARLYARQSAHGRALDALRIGTISRLTVLLALPRHASVVEVSRAVAAVTGRGVDEVHAILVGAMPRNETELLALSDQLLVLEQDTTRVTRLL